VRIFYGWLGPVFVVVQHAWFPAEVDCTLTENILGSIEVSAIGHVEDGPGATKWKWL